jgi:sigma-B regulation protein RsbU (phosphoserine phosphatase)
MIEFEIIYDGRSRTEILGDGDHVIGRGSQCSIALPIPSISKQHVGIRVEGEKVWVRDLGSTNGSELDGFILDSRERDFLVGTKLKLADVMIWHGASPSAEMSFSKDEELSSMLRFKAGDRIGQGASVRIMEMLSSLFELLSSSEDATTIETAACKFVSEWVTADRVAILTDDGEGTELSMKASWSRVPSDEKQRLSSSIVAEVFRDRASVLVSDAMNDPRLQGNESILALDLRSAMAGPLFDNQRVRGILYVDTASAAVTYSEDDLQVLSATANAVAIKLRNLTLEGEMAMAGRIQQRMLPSELDSPEGYEVLAHQVMCRAVGGDLYHCLLLPNGNTLLALGDIVGKGMPAALAMTAATVLLRSLTELSTDILSLVEHLHSQLCQSLADEQFLTLFLAELDATTGELQFVNAGHNPPLLLRKNGELEELPSGGLPVAILPQAKFTLGETHVDKGDLLVTYSDGIPEATRDGDDLLGDDRFLATLQKNAAGTLEEIRDAVIADVVDFLDGEPNSDDVTLLMLRRLEE